MKKWEYWFYIADGANTTTTNWVGPDINALGLLGWEAVGFLGTHSLLMKREVEAPLKTLEDIVKEMK